MEGFMIQVQETRLQRGVVFLSFMIMLLQIDEGKGNGDYDK